MADQTVTTSCDNRAWTPSLQHLNSTLKPVSLLELGENERGKFVRIEFDDESARPLYLLSMEDAWHPLFDSLDWECRWKIRRHQNKREPEQLPDGKVKFREFVSFYSKIKTKRGRSVESVYFDVPRQSYYNGQKHGILAGEEFLAMLKIKSGPDMRLRFMVGELAAAIQEPFGYDGSEKSRNSTAESFLSVLDAALLFAANHADFTRVIAARIKRACDSETRDALEQAREKIDLVDRLRKGREAKRQARRLPANNPINASEACNEVVFN